MAEYEVHIETIGKNELTITILIEPKKRKEFDILISDKGLKITSDLDMRIDSTAFNQIIIDEVD